MKTITLFELGYLDLIRALFFGRKIRLVPGTPFTSERNGVVPTAPEAEGPPREDHFQHDWNPGKMWADNYHLNPFTENPWERV